MPITTTANELWPVTRYVQVLYNLKVMTLKVPLIRTTDTLTNIDMLTIPLGSIIGFYTSASQSMLHLSNGPIQAILFNGIPQTVPRSYCLRPEALAVKLLGFTNRHLTANQTATSSMCLRNVRYTGLSKYQLANCRSATL